uniref:Uncharacterized protein n=1 Tax=Candidatus Kentrum sp. SD TaxID=2126332 RepID=A0A450YHE9_9GAMM|nr:MAG: hypothetical protein BECKSD772F_GA0070984_10777 [Candidatus Kentron sp. SD]VFK47357.1 MAG: hypothetical protein BECKSD772E_GA0070983_109313 [Candidatus Kentron sp. SD]VFK80053.1 MAG: hypothetical protein BECKSD772D_GA0070982_10826 [Candidatus Kentron sp. SD]
MHGSGVNTLVVADFDETPIEQNTRMAAYRDLSDVSLPISVILAFLTISTLPTSVRPLAASSQ